MESQQIITGLAAFFHNVFTVIWVGGLVMIVITLLPSAREVFGNGPQTRDLMATVLRRHRVWVYISIVGLFITGILQARIQPDFHGILRFDTTYSTLTSLKHLLTFAMIAIALMRSFVMTKKAGTASPQQNKRSFQLLFINVFMGLLVLLISGFLTVA